MAKQKEKSELEHLRSENRMLKSEIRNLKKQVGRANKKDRREAYLEKELKEYIIKEEQEQYEVKGKSCPKCKGILETVDLGVRILEKCSTCGHRMTIKKSSE